MERGRYRKPAPRRKHKQSTMLLMKSLPTDIDQMIFINLSYPEIMEKCKLGKRYEKICADDNFWVNKVKTFKDSHYMFITSILNGWVNYVKAFLSQNEKFRVSRYRNKYEETRMVKYLIWNSQYSNPKWENYLEILGMLKDKLGLKHLENICKGKSLIPILINSSYGLYTLLEKLGVLKNYTKKINKEINKEIKKQILVNPEKAIEMKDKFNYHDGNSLQELFSFCAAKRNLAGILEILKHTKISFEKIYHYLNNPGIISGLLKIIDLSTDNNVLFYYLKSQNYSDCLKVLLSNDNVSSTLKTLERTKTVYTNKEIKSGSLYNVLKLIFISTRRKGEKAIQKELEMLPRLLKDYSRYKIVIARKNGDTKELYLNERNVRKIDLFSKDKIGLIDAKGETDYTVDFFINNVESFKLYSVEERPDLENTNKPKLMKKENGIYYLLIHKDHEAIPLLMKYIPQGRGYMRQPKRVKNMVILKFSRRLYLENWVRSLLGISITKFDEKLLEGKTRNYSSSEEEEEEKVPVRKPAAKKHIPYSSSESSEEEEEEKVPVRKPTTKKQVSYSSSESSEEEEKVPVRKPTAKKYIPYSSSESSEEKEKKVPARRINRSPVRKSTAKKPVSSSSSESSEEEKKVPVRRISRSPVRKSFAKKQVSSSSSESSEDEEEKVPVRRRFRLRK